MTEDTKARIAFVELPARDLRAEKVFYEAVFGLSLTDFGPSSPLPLHRSWRNGSCGEMGIGPVWQWHRGFVTD